MDLARAHARLSGHAYRWGNGNSLLPPSSPAARRGQRITHLFLGPSTRGLACLLLLMASACSWFGCARYRLGFDTLYPADIRTVYVPVFESDSFRRGLGERLTEAVVKEIEGSTPLKVVNSPNADSVLSGRIVGDTKRVLVESPTDEARELEVRFLVDVTWATRRGEILRQSNLAADVPLAPNMVDVSGRATLVPEVGQSMVTAQQQIIERLARQIASLMEVEWGPR